MHNNSLAFSSAIWYLDSRSFLTTPESLTAMNISLYEKEVSKALKSGITSHLPNKDRELAKIVVSRIIGEACSEITILCHKLALDVYGSLPVVSALRKAYSRNPRLKCTVYLKDDKPEQSGFLTLLMLHHAKIIGNCGNKFATPSGLLNDFCVVDNKHIRFEKDENTREAEVAFYDNQKATLCLRNLFGALEKA